MQDDDSLLESTFTYGTTGFHAAGTCRMGSDSESVLDPQLRVRGIDRLRVVDTSIMPTQVCGNTNGPGVDLEGSGNLIEGNSIGINAAGTAALGNNSGVNVNAIVPGYIVQLALLGPDAVDAVPDAVRSLLP